MKTAAILVPSASVTPATVAAPAAFVTPARFVTTAASATTLAFVTTLASVTSVASVAFLTTVACAVWPVRSSFAQEKALSTFTLNDTTTAFSVEAEQHWGDRPGTSDHAQSAYSRRALAFGLRMGGFSTMEASDFGTRVGIEVEAKFEASESERAPLRRGLPIGFEARAGVAFQFLTSSAPIPLALLTHFSTEVGAGGREWWSDEPRWGLTVGLRGIFQIADHVYSDVDYTILPFLIFGPSSTFEAKHVEHRIRVMFSLDTIAIGARLTLAGNEVQIPSNAPVEGGTPIEMRKESFGARTLSVVTELRI